jgi:hypothetical protein
MNGVLVQYLFPALELGGGPVAIGALDDGRAVLGHFGQQFGGEAGLGVVGINQDGKFAVFHAALPVEYAAMLSRSRAGVKSHSGLIAIS